MVGRVAGWDPLQRLVRMGAAEPGHECRVLERSPDAIGVGDHGAPEGIDPRLRRHVHAAADVHLAGPEAHVAADAMALLSADRRAAGGRASRGGRTGIRPDPRERRGHVRLVRRLVPAEARVAVDPERRTLRVGLERDAARRQLGGQGRRTAARADPSSRRSYSALAGLEPGPVVVLGKVGQELDRGRREAGERWGRLGHRAPLYRYAGCGRRRSGSTRSGRDAMNVSRSMMRTPASSSGRRAG